MENYVSAQLLLLGQAALLGMLIVQLLRERKHEHTEHSSKQ